MISEILYTGKENARAGREICDQFGISARELTSAVERERRAGQPICASTDNTNPGYYLAADQEEMQEYCNSLYRRGGEIFKTRSECLKAVEGLPKRGGESTGDIFSMDDTTLQAATSELEKELTDQLAEMEIEETMQA